MSNLLLDADNWQELQYSSGTEPPPEWNGTAYEFLGNVGLGRFFFGAQLTYQLSADAGDFIAFTALNISADATLVEVFVNGGSVFSQTVNTGVTLTYVGDALTDGDVPSIHIGTGQNLYSQDLLVTPQGEPTPPVVETCKELGRTTRTYVSGYTLSRQAVTRVRRSSKRCVIANFNGALCKGATIASVRWETTSPWSIQMSNARIATGGRETMVDVFFNFAGWGGLLATVTLDNGEIYNAEFSFTVLDAPLYPTATYPLGNGPYRMDATA